jgi:hypothetical protein
VLTVETCFSPVGSVSKVLLYVVMLLHPISQRDVQIIVLEAMSKLEWMNLRTILCLAAQSASSVRESPCVERARAGEGTY